MTTVAVWFGLSWLWIFPPADVGVDMSAVRAARWGNEGHRIVAEVASARLPVQMPAFFRGAADQLAYLNPEPDRWRDGRRREMNEAYRYDHYIDLENVPTAAQSARDRWEFLEALYAAGIEKPHDAAGFLPFHILELCQRVTNGFARWRRTEDPEIRSWIEARILNDAGILGHFVADAANPHHTTIHFNGWNESRAPNPGGFTTSDDFHARFESNFVSAHVSASAVDARATDSAVTVENARAATWDLIRDSHSQVVRLYELDRDVGFDPSRPADPTALDFTLDRLARGANLLGDLWWSAWIQSAP
jgi:hypothetical protein